MRIHVSLVSMLAVAGLCAGPAAAFTLDILHFNDFHSRVQSINKYDATCSAEDEGKGECFGGVARLSTAIRAAREAAAGPVLVLSAGDNFQGSLFFTTYSGAAELKFLNGLGLDAMVLGNHEFDLGPAPIAEFIRGANFPVVFGNVEAGGDAGLGPLDRDPVILEAGGVKIGIVGAVTPETATIASPGPTVDFAEPVASVTAQVAAMEAAGVDHVILLSHLGVTGDLAVAAAVPGIDAIIGGHSHTLFSNSAEGAAYPYPLMADAPDGRKVPIVQAGSYSKWLGQLRLSFDEAGVVTAASGDTMLLDASVPPDPAVLEEIAAMAAPIEALKAEKVAVIATDVDGSRETCRAGECAMGNLVAEAMLDRVKGQGVTIALQNGGGLRASIEAGEVSKGDVLAVLPFQNTLSTFEISGAGIVAALENGVSQVEEGAGRFPQVAGLKFAWDPRVAPMAGRITEVMVRDGDAWAPIDPAATYRVATNNFMRGGGDGYAVLRDEGRNAYDFGPGMEEVLGDYLAAHPDGIPGTDGRITRID